MLALEEQRNDMSFVEFETEELEDDDLETQPLLSDGEYLIGPNESQVFLTVNSQQQQNINSNQTPPLAPTPQ